MYVCVYVCHKSEENDNMDYWGVMYYIMNHVTASSIRTKKQFHDLKYVPRFKKYMLPGGGYGIPSTEVQLKHVTW